MWKVSLPAFLIIGALAAYASSPGQFSFAIIGDRTGGAIPGVYQQVWSDISTSRPEFVINVGDTIEGGNDATANQEWRQVLQSIASYRKAPLFLVPGNHDVWSAASASAFEKYAQRPLHYSFDYGNAHFTVLNNSRSDSLSSEELAFLQHDLEQHKNQPLKFIVSHRPSWLLHVVLSDPHFPLHTIAKEYGVQYVLAGHIHQMLRFQLDGITYASMASSGGHLRAGKDYRSGWFFGYARVSVHGNSVHFGIKELSPPWGEARETQLQDWGPAGLAQQ